jgi:multisubunit Na+/H+ antiporter MnhG subunit
MTLRHHHLHRDYADEVVATESTSVREPFSVAQAIMLAMGIFFTVVGAIGLARTGVRTWTGDHTTVAGLGMTPLMAVINIVIGVIVMLSSMTRSGARSAGMVFGAALIALGIVAWVQPVRSLGWTAVSGVAYVVAGVAGILTAAMTPVVEMGEEHVVRRDQSRYVA